MAQTIPIGQAQEADGNTTAPSSAYAAAVLADSPTAYWRFEEPSGSTTDDAIGSHDGTVEANTTLGATTFIGNAPLFTQSTTSGIDVAAHSDFAQSGGSFSLEIWVKQLGTSGNQRIFETDDQTIRIYIGGGTVDYGINQGGFQNGGWASGGVLSNGSRHQLVMTWDGATTKIALWVDGTKVSETGALGGSLNIFSTSDIRIGNKPASGAGSDGFDGYIDEIAWYKSTLLTGTQINAHYDARDAVGYDSNAFTPLKVRSIGQATETDLAQSIVVAAYTLDQANETDTANAFSRSKSKATGQTTETDLAQTVSASRRKTFAQATEADAAQTMTPTAADTELGQAFETDLAQPIAALTQPHGPGGGGSPNGVTDFWIVEAV